MKQVIILYYTLDGVPHRAVFYKANLATAQAELDAQYAGNASYTRLARYKSLVAGDVRGQSVGSVLVAGGDPGTNMELLELNGRGLEDVLTPADFADLVSDCQATPTNALAVELARKGLLRA